MKTILILDDEEKFRRHHIDKLKMVPGVLKKFAPKEVTPAQFQQVLQILEHRRAQARRAAPSEFTDSCLLDDASILVVDYDLLSLTTEGVITGENVAYLARCFSRCGLILGLNQFGVNSFDLTLKGHPESFADLNIGSQQLDNHGLWDEPWKGFRPWIWPLIPQALDSLERRVLELGKCMDQPILSWLGIPEVIARLFPRTSTQFITKTSRPTETTFEKFVLDSENGLRGRRDQTSGECRIRIAAARISKWLERLVLSGQDILVDAPHLAARYPSLLKGPKRNVDAFDRAASFAKMDKLGIQHEKLSSALFPRTNWLSRSAWFWPTISNLDTIEEVQEPWKAKQPDLAFCEDISRFKPKAKCQEFVADLSSPFARRYAAKLPNVDYRPEVRFSL
jgi:hypothetical protein